MKIKYELAASPQRHAVNLAGILAFVAMLRLDMVQSAIAPLLRILPPGVYAQRKAIGFYEPLSMIDWVVHFLTMPVNLEIVTQLGQKNTHRSYGILKFLYIMAHVQGLVTLLSHSMIDYHDELQVSFIVWDFFLMRLNVFGTGILLLLGNVGWILMPLLAGLVASDMADFGTPVGIALSTFSMIMIAMSRELPALFRFAWCLLGFLPLCVPSSETDAGHTLGTLIVNLPLICMAYALNGQATLRSEDIKSTKKD